VETLKSKKQTLDQNIKQMFQKGTRFAASKDSPEKAAAAAGSLKQQQSTSAVNSKTSSSKSSPAKHRMIPASSGSPEVRAISAEFVEFLNGRLERAAVADVSRQIKTVIDKIQLLLNNGSTNATSNDCVEELSSNIQEFYLNFQKRLETKQQFHALTDDDVAKILDYAERYITIACYKLLFSPVVSNDEDKDLELQTKIRSLNWISTKELNCTIDESNQDVRNLLFEAINDILEIDGQLAPQDKVNCLVKCSKKVFEMLQLSNESPASADDFLPCLIYVCLKANPPRVQSNINFITRFCNENKLRMGEAGYFFANLCCAMSFIENMTADSINMDPVEFDSYVTGKTVPPGSWRTSLLMCEGLQQMSQNLKSLSEFKTRHDQVLAEAIKLQEEMAAFQADVESEVKAVLGRTQYSLNRPRGGGGGGGGQQQQACSQMKQPINPDAELESDDAAKENLPPPLIPQGLSDASSPSASSPHLSGAAAAAAAAAKMPACTQSPIAASLPPAAAHPLPTIADLPGQDETDLKDVSGGGPSVSGGGGGGNLLEDYLNMSSTCTADNISLLSLGDVTSSNPPPSIDVSSSSMHDVIGGVAESSTSAAVKPQPSAATESTAYRGFTAQSNQITSISCDNSGGGETFGAKKSAAAAEAASMEGCLVTSFDASGIDEDDDDDSADSLSETRPVQTMIRNSTRASDVVALGLEEIAAAAAAAGAADGRSVSGTEETFSTPSSSPLVSAATSVSTPPEDLAHEHEAMAAAGDSREEVAAAAEEKASSEQHSAKS